MRAHKLDALLFPAVSGSALAAKPGYPTVSVPFGFVPNAPGSTPGPGGPAFPDGFDAKPAPYGVSFSAGACSEPKLIEVAYAFEQATKKRLRPPQFP
jgi:amidase